jgi:hypothetical protein
LCYVGRANGQLFWRPKKYGPILESIFFSGYKEGLVEVAFKRQDIERFANKLGIELPKNFGDLIYSFRFRAAMPERIQATAPQGKAWIIRLTGRAIYSFALVPDRPITPNDMIGAVKIPDSTPGLVTKYSFNDEQALLAKVRYNRLIDIFTGVTCYSLQNHLRTTVPSIGKTQVETDEIYIGVDERGVHYVFPVQAKGGTDKLGVVQIEQDIALCADKFPSLICRAIAAQFMERNVIGLFEFAISDDGVKIAREKHYRLAPPNEVTDADLESYKASLPAD